SRVESSLKDLLEQMMKPEQQITDTNQRVSDTEDQLLHHDRVLRYMLQREANLSAKCEDLELRPSRSPPATGDTQTADVENLSLECFPTDQASFVENIQDANIKRYILKMGPCRPKFPFPTDINNRSFSESYYTSTNKVGMKFPRSWMCYSPKLDCCYCEPCWLFANRNAAYYNSAWVNGIRDWKHLSAKVEKHESTQIHLGACIVYEQWKLNSTMHAEMEKNVRNRIVNVTLTLTSCNLPFRGHREVLGQGSAGNLLSIIELLARYDPIQDEIIYIMSQHVKAARINEINEALFYSIIIDTTQDMSKIDQLSQVYRYVTIIENDQDTAIGLQINEVFWGFEAFKGSSASELGNQILDSIEKNAIDLSKCRRQGYDGAANMSGAYSGVQERITEKEPLACYVHCAAHNLNLALNDSVKNVPGVKRFYDTVENLYNFFGHSIKRLALLSEFLTREHEALFALSHRYGNITKALVKISLTSDKKEERNEASALKNAIGKFSFIFLVNMQTKILECINAASQLLQAKDTDILKFRKKFDEAKSATLALAAKWGNSRLTETESNFRVHVLNTCLDIVIQQLSHRFTSLNRTVNIFEPVQPNTLLQAGDEELYQAAKWLSEHYRRDFAPSSPAQLLCRTSFRDQIAKQKSVVDLAKMLIVSHPAVTSTFTEVCAFLLFLTLPVSVASSERSFSKLKIIKNYLRNPKTINHIHESHYYTAHLWRRYKKVACRNFMWHTMMA
uniref:DUF4371 domain-containing protein n=1 Tax=Poecilia mexicana TaxID=48701 RepID=A0A3B3YLV2_9TELE